MVPQQIALGVGVNGALIDVTAYVTGPEGVQYTYGRQNEFRDPSPGQVTFILDNYDGRFTPGNTSSPLATLLTEGTLVCWKFNTRLVAGVVSAIGMASSEEQWGRVTITVGDPLYLANRTTLLNGIAPGMGQQQAYLYWPMNDPATSAAAVEYNGAQSLVPFTGVHGVTLDTPPFRATFGVAGPAVDTQLQVTTLTTGTMSTETGGRFSPITSYPAGSFGCWGFWYTPTDANSTVQVDVTNQAGVAPGGGDPIFIQLIGSGFTVQASAGNAVVTGNLPHVTESFYLSAAISYTSTTITVTLYANGVLIGTNTASFTLTPYAAAQWAPSSVRIYFGAFGASTVQSISHLAHTPTPLLEWATQPTTIANRVVAVMQTVPSLTVGTIDVNASAAILDPQTGTSVSSWSLLCDLLRTEQGHLYTSTSGTLLAPSTVVNFRTRTRPQTPSVTFDAQTEVQGVPQFVRDITNMYSTVTATGPNNSLTLTDRTVIPRAGSATTSETVALQQPTDLRMYVQDRLIRGKNVALQVVSVTIDALTTPTSRYSDLLGLTPGDRVRINNIPSATLGFSSWDGWFLGASEVHTFQSDAFTLYLAPVLPPTGVFDTDLFASGGGLSLNAAVTAGANTIPVVTTDALLETVQVPYTLQIDAEQLVVTACTAPVAGVQTATVTRGANGTTAAAHAIHALVDLASPAIYAF